MSLSVRQFNNQVGYDPTVWTLISLSFGPESNKKDKFGTCLYLHQMTGIVIDKCVYGIDSGPHIDSSSTYFINIGPGLTGIIKEVYFYNRLLRLSSLIKQSGIAMDKKLYP